MGTAVAQSADEKRGYQRGYNRAGSRARDRVKRVLAVAKGYRSRLSDTSADRTCSTCLRWSRGGGCHQSENCLWGHCAANFEYDLEGRMWVDFPVGTPRAVQDTVRIATSQDFGCANWLPKSEALTRA